MDVELPLIDMNQEQVVRILKFIDSTQDEKSKHAIFSELGNECFALGYSKEWGMSFRGNYQKLLDEVNIQKISPYWEKLEFNDDRSVLYLTGKKTSRCVCSFGNTQKPPASLCSYCCKSFQENLFGTVFDRKVEVEITESAILGGERCSTAIHLK
jgi:hypothetical protein